MLRTLLCLALVVAASTVHGQEDPTLVDPPPESQLSASPRERGRYLVHQVAMCVLCHTPQTSDGRLIATRLLQGAPIPVASPYPMQSWAARAPSLAGLGGFSDEALVKLLTTGNRPNGSRPEPPMPPYRMTEEDARAVAAYLKSLR
jgi:mono/diheme cytochrome c family protein